ncbi:MAG: hypothetical protein SFU98_01170 [Leptospiraceae bacterium]|nr:hypothetical protein [Leptospiraceae bacterium]
MNPSVKIVLEIANFIKEENLKGKERIPASDTFVRKMVNYFDKPVDEILFYLDQLRETHYIFTFSLVQPDPSIFVQGVDGYIYAEQSILNELKHYSENKLGQVYESNFYKKKTGFQILREMLPRMKEYNNTPFGRALAEAKYIEEYVKIVSANAFEYTDSWKKEKLFKLYRDDEIKVDSTEEENELNNAKSREPIPNTKWGRAVHQFSTEFLLRIHLRKYEFEVIRKLISTGKIGELDHIVFIRDSIIQLEKMHDTDPILKYHKEKMIELRRVCQGKINHIRKMNAPKVTSQ